MKTVLNADEIRDRLIAFMDTYYDITVKDLAKKIDMGETALSLFMKGRQTAQRRTLGKIYTFLKEFEKSKSTGDPSLCEVCHEQPDETYYQERGDGMPHWVCFDHMKKSVWKKKKS